MNWLHNGLIYFQRGSMITQKLFEVFEKYMVYDQNALQINELETEMCAEMEMAIKTLTGRKPRNLNKAFETLGETRFNEIKGKYQAILNTRVEKRKANQRKAETLLLEFAKTYWPVTSKEMFKVMVGQGGNYHSMGYSCNKYARGSLERQRMVLQMCGFQVEVKEIADTEPADRWGIRYYSYELWANIPPFDYYMLNHKGIGFSEMDYAVLCWRNGVNPKVLSPFLDSMVFHESMKYINDSNYVIHLIKPEMNVVSISE